MSERFYSLHLKLSNLEWEGSKFQLIIKNDAPISMIHREQFSSLLELSQAKVVIDFVERYDS